MGGNAETRRGKRKRGTEKERKREDRRRRSSARDGEEGQDKEASKRLAAHSNVPCAEEARRWKAGEEANRAKRKEKLHSMPHQPRLPLAGLT